MEKRIEMTLWWINHVLQCEYIPKMYATPNMLECHITEAALTFFRAFKIEPTTLITRLTERLWVLFISLTDASSHLLSSCDPEIVPSVLCRIFQFLNYTLRRPGARREEPSAVAY